MKIIIPGKLIRRGAVILAACLWSAAPSIAQQSSQKASKKTATESRSPKKPPLAEAAVQKLWDDGDQTLFLNEVRVRGLAFEPEEDWVNHLKDPSSLPLAIAELRKRIPPAPSVDAVTAAAPGLLSKLKDAAQKKSESDLEPLVHPNFLPDKAKLYDLFDNTNYRDHTLGRIAPMDNRRVGVQFFQLTASQVERLHYLEFSTSYGKIVLRDVITGPDVAALFLHDEEKIATSKLDVMFRALNDHDDTALRNICSPGMYDSLRQLTDGGGSTLVRGKYTSISAIAITPSVSLDQKAARVVVKVGYPDPASKPLDYFVDFERIGNDMKIVRVRDIQGGVVAWDPNIDNYLNRRYNLPDGPPVTDVPKSDDIRFYPLSMVRDFVYKDLETRNAAKLKELAAEFIAREPSGGDGYGIRAAAEYIAGSFDDAAKDAMLAIDRGGTVYFVLLRHSGLTADAIAANKIFLPVILGVSKTRIDYRPFVDQGKPAEQIATASVTRVQIETRYGAAKGRPFMNLNFNDGGNKDYNFAAFGTACAADKPSAANLEAFSGSSVCPAPAGQQQQQQPAKKSRFGGLGLPGGISLPTGGIPGMPGGNKNSTGPMLVPHAWQQDLAVVVGAVDEARRGGANQAKN